MSTAKKNTEEEVDLGSLFIVIGKGFKNLFNFIFSLLKGLFHFLILTLLFVKRHFVKLFIAGILGGAAGSFFEFTKEETFGSDLIVQPNFKSSRQLYNNINYYNDLVEQKDTATLSSTFKLSKEQAGGLRKFEIYPIIDEDDIVESYDELILSVDTLTAKGYSFNQFKRSFTDYDYQIHQVHVEAIDKGIFSKLDDIIISAVIQNQYFDKVKKLTNENLFRTDSLLRTNLGQIDSLRKVYMEVLIKEADKESQGTTIDLGSQKKTTKELELFQTNRSINSDLKGISEEISEKSEVINIISNFQPVGYEIKGIEKNFIFLGGAFGVFLILLFILLKDLNSYLEKYKDNS